MKATAALDKESYESHELVKLKVTYTNKGSVAAEALHATAWGVQVDRAEWGELAYDRPGVRLEPGETRTVEVTGVIQALEPDGKLLVSGSVTSEGGDANPLDNSFYAYATVTKTTGNVTGSVYADKNRNGQFDSGEAIFGGSVSIWGGSPAAEQRTTSDADGRFSFTGIPTGGYYAPDFALPDGWVVHTSVADQFTVTPNQTTETSGRAERPYTEVLTATGSLDQEAYLYPAKAKVSLTLKNVGTYEISGIEAACGRSGEGSQLGQAPGWGDLLRGITLAAGESRSFEINEDLPESALRFGTVYLDCDFAPNPGWNNDGPRVTTRRR